MTCDDVSRATQLLLHFRICLDSYYGPKAASGHVHEHLQGCRMQMVEEKLAIHYTFKLKLNECLQMALLQNAYVHKAMLHQSCWHIEVAVKAAGPLFSVEE